jgi:uncharacterized SAM-binding protein YcdF (DUF218 family)
MTISSFASGLVRLSVTPPVNLLLLIALGYLLRRRWPRAGRTVSRSAIVLLLVISTTAGSLWLVAPLENMNPPLTDARAAGAQAIVVLSAGSVNQAPEYGGQDAPDPVTLVRMQYGAYLQHRTGLPLLTSGGIVSSYPSPQPLALMMARALREDFRTPVTWIEDRSQDTDQNALYSARMLKAAGVRRVLLVTHAMHMPRAREAFERQGMEVVAAPTMFYAREKWSPYMLLPSASGLYRSYYATHEWIGLAWYRLRRPPQAGAPTPAAPRSSI